MRTLIILLLLSSSAFARQPSGRKTVHFDMVEVNVFCNEWGYPVFAQLLLWDWHRKDKKFHVEKWFLMKDAFVKTPEGEKKHEEQRRKIEQKYRSISMRKAFLNGSKYRGDFVGGKLYPRKNYRLDRYEVPCWDEGYDLLIVADIMRLTYTQYDPERQDRKHHPEQTRKGLPNAPKQDPLGFMQHIIDISKFLAHP
jgi:hypothetical protein